MKKGGIYIPKPPSTPFIQEFSPTKTMAKLRRKASQSNKELGDEQNASFERQWEMGTLQIGKNQKKKFGTSRMKSIDITVFSSQSGFSNFSIEEVKEYHGENISYLREIEPYQSNNYRGRYKVCEKNNKEESKLKYMEQFFFYILDFKLKQKGSYKTTKLVRKAKIEKENIKINCSSSILSARKNSRQIPNFGYACDMCQMDPIIGHRYHCSSHQCKDDYDLCSQCYGKSKHEHQMEKVVLSPFNHYLFGYD